MPKNGRNPVRTVPQGPKDSIDRARLNFQLKHILSQDPRGSSRLPRDSHFLVLILDPFSSVVHRTTKLVDLCVRLGNQ